MWQKALQGPIAAGKLVAIGVVQEQHPDRARLYQQWRQLGWPLYVDSLNVLGHRVVPIPMLIDESGRIVQRGRFGKQQLDAFLATSPARGKRLPATPPKGVRKGDALFYAGKLDQAIAAYKHDDFRLGVALRRRYESKGRHPTDGQDAVAAWLRALASDPNQYIWRRRIQQYGPRLAKPYNFYGWIEQARAEIRARGDEPVPLSVEPRGTELIGRGPVMTAQIIDADPEGKIDRDDGFVRAETIVTPPRVPPGHPVRVRVIFRTGQGLWNNEADPLTMFMQAEAPLSVGEGLFSHRNAKEAESSEPRVLEFEVLVPKNAKPGKRVVRGYALYSACDKKGGVCRYLRRDIAVDVTVDPKAPTIR